MKLFLLMLINFFGRVLLISTPLHISVFLLLTSRTSTEENPENSGKEELTASLENTIQIQAFAFWKRLHVLQKTA